MSTTKEQIIADNNLNSVAPSHHRADPELAPVGNLHR